jgi:hypothetical protein
MPLRPSSPRDPDPPPPAGRLPERLLGAQVDSLLGGQVDSLLDAAAYPRAARLAAGALARLRALPGPDSASLLAWQLRAGGAELELGRYDAADSLLEEARALAGAIRAPDADRLQVERLLLRLRDAEEAPGARARAERCVALARGAYGADDPRVAPDLVGLARVALAEDRLREADSLLGEAARLAASAAAPDSSHLAAIADAQGWAALEHGDYAGAALRLERSAALTATLRGADHPAATWPLVGLAEVRQRQGDLERAEELLGRCLAIRERAYGPGTPTSR